MLRIPHEEPKIDHVEALKFPVIPPWLIGILLQYTRIPESHISANINRIFYYYSLNRPKNILYFCWHEHSSVQPFRALYTCTAYFPVYGCEHRKRVWWTSYCLDRMTSSDSVLEPAFHSDLLDLDYLNDSQLPEEKSQGSSTANYLTV